MQVTEDAALAPPFKYPRPNTEAISLFIVIYDKLLLTICQTGYHFLKMPIFQTAGSKAMAMVHKTTAILPLISSGLKSS